MPIFEYRCAGCRRTFSLLVARSEDDMLDDLADPSKIGDMEDPRQMVQGMKRMGKEMGEDLGDDFDELVEEAAREEAEGAPEDGSDLGGDLPGPAGGDEE